jgi:hypothetical protein
MRTLLLFIILAACQKVSAQGTAGGFKVGMNLTNIKGDFGRDFETVSKVGFHVLALVGEEIADGQPWLCHRPTTL